MANSNTHTEHHDGGHHSMPLKVYFSVFAALIFLTVITVWIAQFHFGILNGFIAMFVATIKATLVGMYFMHLKFDNKLYATILVGSVGFLILLWIFSLFDFGTRVLEVSPL